MTCLKLKLKPGREKSLFYRHPWIFSGGLDLAGSVGGAKIPDGGGAKIQDGSIVDICDSGGNFLARGYYNSQSDIAVRVLSFDPAANIDVDFFVRKLQAALALREPFLAQRNVDAFRVVFAESDLLPGLIVDKYDEVLVVQIHTLGMDLLRPILVEALVKVFAPKLIYERSDVVVRRKEGLKTMPCGVLYGNFDQLKTGVNSAKAGADFVGTGKRESSQNPLIKIHEGEVDFWVDIVGGQKTGFFLDQRENRWAIKPYVKGAEVLNLFCYSGGFSCNALAFGAAHVTSVDISKEAIELCEKNVALNGFDSGRHTALVADVFEYLEKGGGRKFDVVIVDPPAFVKSQKDLKNALKAYSRLNGLALNVLKPGGILISSSCSSYVSPEMFKSALFQAALKTRSDLVVLESRTQPFDHPLRLYFPEGEYLKFFVCKKR